MKFEILHFAATTPRHCQTSLATCKPNKQNGTVEQNASISKSSDKNREVNVTLVRILSARVELVCLWKVGPLHDVYTDFYRDLAFKAISTPLKHQKIIAFECFRNFRATARSCNATDQSRACKIRVFFWLLQLFIQLRGSGTGSKNHPTTRFGDWIKKCIQVLKRPCVFANALTRDNV